MQHRNIPQKEKDFVALVLTQGKTNPKLIHAWYRGLRRLKRDLTPNNALIWEYPN